MDHAFKLKFGSYVHLPSINKMFPNHYACVILCSVGEVIILSMGTLFKFWNILEC